MYCNYNMDDEWNKENLHATALEFKILRQHGYSILQGIYVSYKFFILLRKMNKKLKMRIFIIANVFSSFKDMKCKTREKFNFSEKG